MTGQKPLPGFEDMVRADEGIGLAEARQISVDAQENFEDVILEDIEKYPQAQPLFGPYYELRAQGWGWRQALYIAWKRLPAQARHPRTEGELAHLLGLRSARTIRKWRAKNPRIDQIVRESMLEAVLEGTAEILEAARVVALGDYKGHNDRKMLLEIGGVYKQKQDVTLTTTLTADQLEKAQKDAVVELDEWESERFDAAVAATMEFGDEDED